VYCIHTAHDIYIVLAMDACSWYRQEDSFFAAHCIVERRKKEEKKRKRTRENSCGTAAQGSIRTDVDVGAHLSQVRLDKREGGTLRCTLIAHLYRALPSTHNTSQISSR
jgi:hypothetical protein